MSVRPEDVELLLPIPKDPNGMMYYMFDANGPRHQYRNWTARQIAARIDNMTKQRARRISHETGAE